MGDYDKKSQNIKPILINLYRLRHIEHSNLILSKKYAKAKPLINKTTSLLIKYKDFLSHRPLWNELHDCMVYYYDYLNLVNLNQSIPLFRGNLHNEFGEWYYKLYKHTGHYIIGSLLHFDTHDDMGLLDNKNIIKNKHVNVQLMSTNGCNQINYPVTCLLLNKKLNHIVWALPKWTYDHDYSTDQYLVSCKKNIKGIAHKNDLIFLRPNNSIHDQYLAKSDIVVVNQKYLNPTFYNFFHKFKFDRIHTNLLTNWHTLAHNIINMNHNTFILDIDLDYFVTNGDIVEKTIYMNDFNDLQSDIRSHGEPPMTLPRDAYTDNISLKYNKLLQKEFKAINVRLKTFIKGCKILKHYKLYPVLINFSDSTPSFFSGNPYRATFNNNYTPKYFVPYIHHFLIKELNKLYDKLI